MTRNISFRISQHASLVEWRTASWVTGLPDAQEKAHELEENVTRIINFIPVHGDCAKINPQTLLRPLLIGGVCAAIG
jgi:hypothetical protein